jgi:hypothetical protein
MGQGRDQAKEFLKANPAAMVELRKQLLAAKGIGGLLMSAPEPDAEGVAPVDAAVEDKPKKKKH